MSILTCRNFDVIKALNLSKEYPLDEKEDIQAMLYTFAEGLLNKEQIARVTKLPLIRIDELEKDKLNV